MGGLLYKDFVSACRIKKVNFIWILIGLTLLFAVLRMCANGDKASADFLITNENGESIYILDIFFVLMQMLFMFICYFMSNSFVERIAEDDKNKIKGYFASLPIGKHDYVASKYIFIVIGNYVFLSFEMIWGIICSSYICEGAMKDVSQMGIAICPIFICVSFIMAAIELPLFLIWGREKAMYGKVIVLTVVALIFVGYLLFGELIIFENIDIFKIVNWFEAHQTDLIVLNTIFPGIVAVLYYASYKLACALLDRREN